MTKPNELNDSLDDIFGAPSGPVRSEPIHAPANYKPKEFSEACPKCRGSGHWRPGYPCFKCNGLGRLTFKTAPETRSKKRASTNSRKAKEAAKISAEVAAFKLANPAVTAWIFKNVGSNGFAASLSDKLFRYGSLTQGQIDAVQKNIGKYEAAKLEREAAAPAADTAGIDRLKLAFDTAIANSKAKGRTLKMPRITIGGVVISPAKATSTNPGAIYVKEAGQYLGKIKDGRFYAVRECTPEQEKHVLAFVADPKAAAIAYGIETGVCCICNATLTNKASIAIGIGPICATKFGW